MKRPISSSTNSGISWFGAKKAKSSSGGKRGIGLLGGGLGLGGGFVVSLGLVRGIGRTWMRVPSGFSTRKPLDLFNDDKDGFELI